MSTPKRLHEEGNHSSPLKRALEDTALFSSITGKLSAPVGNDLHQPFEPGQDGRMAKVQRIEPREVDKRSSLLHRMSSSPSNSHHPITSENRSELRNPKDARDVKTEIRETRSESRELHSDMRMDPPVSKAENEVRLDNCGDDKEFRCERGSYIDFKGDFKFERESYAAASSDMNCKESKEQHRGKRYFDSSTDNVDSWRVARHGSQNTVEVANLRVEEWDSSEAHEAVGENKIDMKGEEKCREKEKKKKEEKHRDFGEQDQDKNEQQNNMQLGEATNERKEETDRWDRERKDIQRDKDHTERDTGKRESPSANEKVNLHNSKDTLDGSGRISGHEIKVLEPNSHKEDSWKVSDRETKDRKRERDADLVERHERGKSYDKELDDVSADGEGVSERDREALGNSIQQRRRLLRTRGTPQTPNRDPRFRPRVRDNEGYAVKHLCSMLRVGNLMQPPLPHAVPAEHILGYACI